VDLGKCYGCIVYGSARSSYLRMLDPIQNHTLRLCLGAYRTSPSSSLCVLANEPALHLRRQKLSIQYCLRLSSTSQNPAYGAVFNSKFKPSFQRKPNQIPPLGIRIHSHLQAIGFRRKDTLQCPTLPPPPWLLHRPEINFSLHSLHKDDTAPEIFRHNFNELCADYSHFTRLYTDGSKMGDGVASAVVSKKSCKTVWLPSNASIFRAELYAISQALNIIRRCRDKDFIIFSDSMSSLQALSGFKLEIDLVQKILKDYTTLTKSGKKYCSMLDFKPCQHSP